MMPVAAAGKRVLYIDDRIPEDGLGAGLPRARQIILRLLQVGCSVVVYPVLEQSDAVSRKVDDPHLGTAVIRGRPGTAIADYLMRDANDFDLVWISRLHNIEHVEASFAARRTSLRAVSDAVIVYDAEALVALRDVSRAVMSRKPVLGSQMLASIRREAATYRSADRVVCVSRRDQKFFADCGVDSTVLGHVLDVDRTTVGFKDRDGIVLAGNLLTKGSPNFVSADWFLHQV